MDKIKVYDCGEEVDVSRIEFKDAPEIANLPGLITAINKLPNWKACYIGMSPVKVIYKSKSMLWERLKKGLAKFLTSWVDSWRWI